MHRYKDFEDIRPYYDEEIPEALKRITAEPFFGQVMKFLFPDRKLTDILAEMESITNIYDFQVKIMHPVVWTIVRRTTNGLTASGFEDLDPEVPYLFLANHRDIFLDSAFLQIMLYEYNLPNSQITFGNNLMTSQLLVDTGKVNRMFTVYRGGTRKEKYINSQRLSSYIRETITQRKESIWIAQREGRTKDGNDLTHPGLLKMLFASHRASIPESLKPLNLVPLSISYEFEPCDNLKVQERYLSQNTDYVKKPGEDLNSILAGTLENKGRVHLAAGRPIHADLDLLAKRGELDDPFGFLSERIDVQMHALFKLFPNNYIALDLLEGKNEFAYAYSSDEKEQFMKHLNKRMKSLKGESQTLEKMLLEMYAYPVKNRIAQQLSLDENP